MLLDGVNPTVAILEQSRYELKQIALGYELIAKSEGMSDKTIQTVGLSIKTFNQFLEMRCLPSDVRMIDASILRHYSVYLQGKNKYMNHVFTPMQTNRITMHTVSVYLRGLSSFWSWLERDGIINDNPFKRIRLPKPPNKIVPHFSNLQIIDLFRAINKNTPCGFRNYAMALLLFDTGIRCAELCSIKLCDVDIETRRIKVWGKGSRERIVPIGARTQDAIRKYLRFYRAQPRLPEIDRLFLTDDGDPLKNRRVQTIIRQYGQKAGIAGVRLSPHTFRHTMAIQYLRNGGDVFTLQRILGHSSLQMTVRYVALEQQDIDRVHRRSSPGDMIGI